MTWFGMQESPAENAMGANKGKKHKWQESKVNFPKEVNTE